MAKKIDEKLTASVLSYLLRNAHGKANAKTARKIYADIGGRESGISFLGFYSYLERVPRIAYSNSKNNGGFYILANRAEAVDLVERIRQRAKSLLEHADEIAREFGIITE